MTMNIINQYDEEQYEPLLERVLKACYEHLGVDQAKVINIILVDNPTIKSMNHQYRMKDYVTDVLTFPSDLDDELGDVFIAVSKAEIQAKDYGHSFERELAFLTVHGFLHTLGYDHETIDEEKQMFALQETILKQLNITR